MLSQTISARYRRRLLFVCSVSQRSGSETSDSGINGVHFTELSWTSVFISAKSVATVLRDAVLAFAPRHVLQWAGDDPSNCFVSHAANTSRSSSSPNTLPPLLLCSPSGSCRCCFQAIFERVRRVGMLLPLDRHKQCEVMPARRQVACPRRWRWVSAAVGAPHGLHGTCGRALPL